MIAPAGQNRHGHLLAILANPPLHASTITAGRTAWAANVLLFDSYEIANIFPLATRSVLEISSIGQDRETWLLGRKSLALAIERADGVLLGYGCQEPIGNARTHHREQAAWVKRTIYKRGLDVWMLGDRPHHPSRWQRHTSKVLPGVPFPEAVARTLKVVPSVDLTEPPQPPSHTHERASVGEASK